MDTNHLDESLVLDFCEVFFGYGSFKAPIWLVGMEEGGGESAEEIQRRLQIWDQRGRQNLEIFVNTITKSASINGSRTPSRDKKLGLD